MEAIIESVTVMILKIMSALLQGMNVNIAFHNHEECHWRRRRDQS
jgi:hypothetical protein